MSIKSSTENYIRNYSDLYNSKKCKDCREYISQVGPTGYSGENIQGAYGPTGDSSNTGPTGPTGGIGPTGPKSFIIEHPLDNEKYLVHGCIESNKVDVYYRGIGKTDKNGEIKIRLPKYFKELCKISESTVLITGIYPSMSAFMVKKIKKNKIIIKSEKPEQSFNWMIKSERKGCEFETEMNKNSGIKIKGDGPYLWVS
uniref:Uncharacterized protein n=1 Tax=viral metagenome TaxID=1070528 RepID=A0A6C0H5A0_9ZZZZ